MSDRRISGLLSGPDTSSIARTWKQTRFNPLRGCTPLTLTRDLDLFEAGWLRNATLIWSAIEDRDDMARTVISKRKKAVSHRPWEIVTLDESDTAQAHKGALESFFNHLTVTDALDLNQKGGLALLIRQMMGAQFAQYAAHEIIWQPDRELRAELKHVPIFLFENTSGELRYTGPLAMGNGQKLDPEGWMVTVGDGLMKAISVCWMFKRLSLQDWLNFSERFGTPGIHGETSAQKGTPEWDDFVNALHEFSNDWVMASSSGSSVKLVESGKTGDQPFKPMVDRMDQAIARLVRGGDLSSISRENAVGASLQVEETALLEKDDCSLISETLNLQLTRKVIAYVFGFGVEPLAYIKIQPTPTQDVKLDMDVDNHLRKMGVPLGLNDIAERYGRTLPSDEETHVSSGGPESDEGLWNESQARELETLREAINADLSPVKQAITRLLESAGSDDNVLMAKLEELQAKWPQITSAVLAGEASEAAFSRLLSEAFVSGLDLKEIIKNSASYLN